MNKEKRNKILDYGAFTGYLIVGIISRYLLIPYCNPFLIKFHQVMSYAIMQLVIIGVVWGLISFFFPKITGSTFGKGMMAGFGAGFGGMTVIALLEIQCI